MAAITTRLGQQATLRHGLGLTPALQQSIKLLELSNLALAQFLAEALAENPLLELAEGPGGEKPRLKPQALRRPARGSARPLPPGLARLFSGARQRTAAGSAEESAGEVSGGGPSLQDHLLQQLGADITDPAERAIGRALIESLDEAGYLSSDPDGLARLLGQRPDRVSRLLSRLQQFDPPGVFARSLAECLALQLADRGRLDDAMGHLLANLELLARGDRGGLMQRCGVDEARLAAMIAELRRLDPRPGLAFERGTLVTVIPDLTIEPAAAGGWHIELNDQNLPRLAINEGYRLPPSADGAAKQYLKERRATASWLLRALDRRADTLLRITHELVRCQAAFLEGGAGALKPLSRRDVAVALDLHESTVGRATVNKYAATPRGVLALTDFFGGRLASATDRLGHAPLAVRAQLKGLIEAEPADRPISDERLAQLLRQRGIAIARRTVAKYREMLRIPPSFQRSSDKTL
jgi:RNA polymerase sigma-54 factor